MTIYISIYIFAHAFYFITAGWVILSFQSLSRSKAFQGVFGWMIWIGGWEHKRISPSAIILVSLGVAVSQYGNAALHCTERIYLMQISIYIFGFISSSLPSPYRYCSILCHLNIQFLSANTSLARLRSVLFYLSSSFYGVASCSEYIQPNSFILLNWHILHYHVHKFCAKKQGLWAFPKISSSKRSVRSIFRHRVQPRQGFWRAFRMSQAVFSCW